MFHFNSYLWTFIHSAIIEYEFIISVQNVIPTSKYKHRKREVVILIIIVYLGMIINYNSIGTY